MKRKLFKQAFSIIEISIVLIIIAVLSSMILSSGTKQIEQTKLDQTMQKMQLIKENIESFVLLNNRLPCPANANLDIRDNNSGIEDCNGNISANVTSLPSVTPSITNNEIIGGSIPFTTLMLPSTIAVDGWGNKFSFIVSKGLTSTPNGFDSQTSGIIKIQNWAGTLINNITAFVVISHGKSGGGAWRENGARIASGSNSKKLENSHTTNSFNELFTLNLSQKLYDIDGEFDDMIIYQTKNNILGNLGYYLSGQICNQAYQAVKSNDQPANFLCNGSGGDSNGTLSHYYCNEYLLNLAYEVKARCNPRIE